MTKSKYPEKLRLQRARASLERKRRNKEHVAAKLKEWSEKNKEHRSKYHSDRWRENKEELSKRKADRYYSPGNIAMREKYKPIAKQKNVEWRKKNPEACRDLIRKRAALQLDATVGDTKIIRAWEKAWRSNPKVRCYWCSDMFSPKGCHVDHIIPLKRKGPHEIGNLCIACSACNLTKNRKSLDRWNSQISEPVLF